MQPLRIAYLGSSTALDGGSELRLLAMATHFNTVHKVVLFLPDKGPLFQEAQVRGIHTVSLDFLRLRRHHGTDWVRWIRSVRQASEVLGQALMDQRVDLVHFNDFIDLPFYGVPARLGIPALSHLRLITGSLPARFYSSWAAWNRIHVLAVSKAVRKQMLKDHSGEVLYDPGPDPEVFRIRPDQRRSFRQSQGWQDHHLVIGMVSKLLENKGHRNFIRLAQALQSHRQKPGEEGKLSDRYRFVMVGGLSPGRENYFQEIAREVESFPSGSFAWMREQPHAEIAGILNACDLFLHLPDTEDSFPGVVLEAMACGVPVVAHDLGGIREQLADGEAGCLVRQGDIEGLLQVVHSLSLDPERRHQIARAGRERIEREFNPDRHFQALDDVYHQMVKRKR